MKNYLLMMVLLAGALSFGSCTTSAYVTARPGEVMYTRPAAPGPDYIWIDGDWMWSGGRYIWHEGRWDRPRAGRTWHGGSWSQTPRGYRWNRGHW